MNLSYKEKYLLIFSKTWNMLWVIFPHKKNHHAAAVKFYSWIQNSQMNVRIEFQLIKFYTKNVENLSDDDDRVD